jgi:hypothetical protein
MDYGTVVTIPVYVVASTADQRVSSLSGPGTVRATVTDTALSQLQLWSSNDLVCRSETDTLPYRSADCTAVQKVTAQLGLNQYSTSPQTDGGRLELYVYLRASTASPGAADQVDRIELSR